MKKKFTFLACLICWLPLFLSAQNLMPIADGVKITKNSYNFQNGTNTVDVTSSLNFFDNGGATAPYTTAAKGSVRFVPKTGEVIKLVFKSFATHYSDYLFVYNGDSTDAAHQLAKISGTKIASTMPADILSTAADGSLTVEFDPTNSGAGWEIEVISYSPLALTISDVTVTAPTADKLLKGAQKERMLKVAVTLEGDTGNFDFNQFSFTTDEAGSAAIANAKLFYSGNLDVLSNDLYSAQSSSAPFVFNAHTHINTAGTYYFWLTYDIANNAAIGTAVTATLQSIQEAQAGNIVINQNQTATRTVEAGFSGTYTIGASATANYNTFAAAVGAMKDGVDGKVIFEIENGTYNEIATIPHIPGASAENTIVMKSKSGNYNDVTIEVNNYPSSVGGGKTGIFKVSGADFFTLDGVTVKTNKATYDAVVLVNNISEHVTVKNCLIQAPRSSSYSSGNIALFRVEGANEAYANSDYATLENNQMDGGYSGAYIYGTGYVSLPKQKGAQVVGNTFQNQGSMAVYITKEHGGIVENNTIVGSGNTGTPYKAIDAVMIGNTIIRNNRINVSGIGSNADINAIYLRRRDNNETLEGRNKIYNNQVIITANNGTRAASGIFNSSPILTNTDIAYNSILIMNETAKTNTAAVHMTSTASIKPENVKFENNIFQNNAGGYVYYFNRADALEGLSFSNNGLFTSGENFAYAGSATTTFDDWKTLSNETNSVVEKAEFLSDTSLDLTNPGSLRAAKPLDFVTTDINGIVRHETTPTMGAYEYVVILMPQMAEEYPKVENIIHNAATAKVKITENGKVFILAHKTNESAPTQADVLQGVSIDAPKNTEVAMEITPLESQTEYKLYFVLQSMSGENSEVIASNAFTTTFLPTQVATFEDVPVGTETEFTNGTAMFNGFKIVSITDGQGENNTQAAQLLANGVVTITNNPNGLILNGFYMKSDNSVVMVAQKGETEVSSQILSATEDKWVFINLKDLSEITSVTLSGTGNTLIDNFSGMPQPITFMLEDKTVNQGETVTVTSDIYGGVLPYAYKWQNSAMTTLSEEANLTFTADHTSAFTLTVTDAWGATFTGKSVVTVIGTAQVATFDDLHLAPESYWWGDSENMTSVFYSGSYSFTNTLVEDYNTWAGFGYSNKTATSFENFLTDQFNSSVGHGVSDSENYAVVYMTGDPTRVSVTNNTEGEVISGFYITNNAWVKHCSENGTGMGDTPNAPFGTGDWYKIIAKGDNDNTAEFYLADYRSPNQANHYTLTSWQWFDLRSLGQVKSIRFSGEGTRPNAYGSTIPFYFCMDDFGGARQIANAPTQSLYTGETQSIMLSDIFTNLRSSSDVIYEITDAPLAETATAVVESGELLITGIAEGSTSLIVKQTIKGESIFVKIPVTVSFHTSSANISDDTNIIVSPNPADKFVTINTSGAVSIYTLDGSLVKTVNNYQANENVDVQELNSGVYLIKIIKNNKTFIFKFIKQ